MVFLIFVALVGWIPVCLTLFVVLPARQATIASVIGAWLFLPPVSIPIALLPDYDKSMAAVVGIILATLIFQPHRLLSFRPHWFDLPILIWCLCPIASSLSNDLGLYDGLSASLATTVRWGLPYLIGRLYFGDQEGLRDLTIGIVIGGLLYVLPCIYEIRMSPMLQVKIYGTGGWEGMRMGGYRPKVFFATGLELGMWMTAVSLTTVWLWKSRSLTRIGAYPVGSMIMPLLVGTTIMCRSTGALLLMLSGLSTLWLCTRFNAKFFMWALLLVAPVYYTVRIPNYWTGKEFTDLIGPVLGEERVASFEYRLRNENLLARKAMERPTWGWGGWGRNRVYDASGRDISITDGMWIIQLGVFGFVGLISWTAVLLLPSFLFVIRYPVRSWATPEVGPLAALATLLGIYIIDCLMNAFGNLVYGVTAGGLIAAIPSAMHRISTSSSLLTSERTALQGHPQSGRVPFEMSSEELDGRSNAPNAQERLAGRYMQLARALKDQGRPDEAKAAWTHALAILTELSAASPETPGIQKSRHDCANDFAWFLLSEPGGAEEDLSMALNLATQATRAEPDRGAYWNTLGAATYRAGDPAAAITALERSIALNHGPSIFDQIFMSMAHVRLRDREEARRWYDQAAAWIEEHDNHHAGLMTLFEEARETLHSRDNPSPVP